MGPVAFEVEDGVDQVLEHAWPGERPLAGHVTDQEARHAARLALRDEQRRRLAHLADAPGGRLEARRVEGLDRIHDHGGGTGRVQGLDHRLGARLGDDQHPGLRHPEPIGTEPHLLGRLLAGDVEDGHPLPRERAARLEGERRLADAGVAADEHDRALDEATAQHAIELGEAGRATERLAGRDRHEGPHRRRRPRASRPRLGYRLLHDRVPRPAARALAEPARRGPPAFLADPDRPACLVNHCDSRG